MNKNNLLPRIIISSILSLTLGLVLSGCDSNNVSSDTDSLLTVDNDGNTSVESGALETNLDAIDPGEISPAERAGLIFMREEEKLAHDVYLTLFNTWDQKIFQNISKSELTHTDAMLSLLDKYGIPDPVGSNAIGVFVNQDLQALNDSLVNTGNSSLIDALQVGAAIEEIDIIDIEVRQAEVVENDDIVIVYDNLIKGSRNHLRAFVKNLENQGIIYQPQYLSQEEYDAIVSTDTERGG